MANEVLIKAGTQFLFADHATDFGAAPATAANSLISGTPTDVQMDNGSIADGAGRASAKVTLGTPWSREFAVDACLEFATAPTEGSIVEFYWAASPSSTAANGNSGALTGSDEAYTPAVGKDGQFQYIGTLSIRNNVLNIGHVGTFTPTSQYGMLVLVNRTGTALATTADETHIVMTPVIDEVQ